MSGAPLGGVPVTSLAYSFSAPLSPSMVLTTPTAVAPTFVGPSSGSIPLGKQQYIGELSEIFIHSIYVIWSYIYGSDDVIILTMIFNSKG